MSWKTLKPKILVEIIGPNGIKSRKKYEIEGNTVVISKAKRGRGPPAYKPKFTKDCIVPYRKGIWPFKMLKHKLILMEGANECITFFDAYGVFVPTFDRSTSENLFQANVIKSAGTTATKVQVPLTLYLFLGIILALTLMNFLTVTGRVRFG